MKATGMKSDRLGTSALADGGSNRLESELRRILEQVPPELAGRTGLGSCEAILSRLETYIKEIELWNPKLGLVEAVGPELLVRHFFDCLVLIPHLAEQMDRLKGNGLELRLGDIGSGAGFPGLVLAACFPDLRVDLVEKQGRRCGFLLNAKSRMGLKQVQVCELNLEDLSPSTYSLLTARAFKPLEPLILASLKRVMKKSGTMLFLKGRMEKINEELEASGLLGNPGLSLCRLDVKDLPEERHLLTLLND